MVVNIQPNLAEAHNLTGVGLEELGRLDESVKSYQTAVKIDPNFSEAYNNLGNILKKLGRLDEAVKSYQKALEIAQIFLHCIII